MPDPATGELFKAKAATSDEVNPVVEVFMRKPTVSLLRFTGGHALDPAAALKVRGPASKTIADPVDRQKSWAGWCATQSWRRGRRRRDGAVTISRLIRVRA